MRILSVNQSDIDGGAARASHRLASKLLNMNCDLKMLVMRKLGKDEWVLAPRGFQQMFVSRLLPRLDLITKRIVGVHRDNSWSLNLFPNYLMNTSFANSFDVIHLNWVGKNMLPLSKIHGFAKPIVWTLHDSWAFTGGCHVPAGCRNFENSCGNCPQLNNGEKADISHEIWLKKSSAYTNLPLHFIAPSRWIADEARASSLLKTFPVFVIPNGLDTTIFAPRGKADSRVVLGLPSDKRIILFGAMYADTDKNKGLDLLIEALNVLDQQNIDFAKQNVVVIFGTANQALSERFPLPIICLGMINDENKLARIYSAADLVVVPSRSESFGQVASESLSCGTPVVAFNTTGLKDIVDHKVTGYLAECFQPVDLANGIRLLGEASDIVGQMSENARQRAVERFDIHVTAKMHLDLFKYLYSN